MVSGMNPVLIQRTKRTLFVVGVALLIGTAIVVIALAGGLFELPQNLFAGESTVHSVARVAIIGCLLAALGSME